MNDEDKILAVTTEIVSKVYNEPVVFRRTKAQHTILSKFIEWCVDVYGVVDRAFLAKYVCYHCSIYFSDDAPEHRVQLSWIYGNKAIERWSNRKESWYYYILQFTEVFNIDLHSYNEPEYLDFTYDEHLKEIIRYTSNDILQSCASHTTLWNPQSSICQACKHQEDCKYLLKKTYYDIYEHRTRRLQQLQHQSANS